MLGSAALCLGIALATSVAAQTPAPTAAASEAGPTAYAAVDPAVSFPTPGDAAVVPEPRDPEAGLVRRAIDTYRKGDIAGGDSLRAELKDPGARTAVDWAAIRSGLALGFERIVSFFRANTDWPWDAAVRRRAEESLFTERKPAATVRAFFAARRPTTPSGKLALAIALRADGLERDATVLVRETWHDDLFSREFEAKVTEAFPNVLTQADHRARMERALFKENWETATRAAALAGKDYATLVKARRVAGDKSKKTAAVLDAVPAGLRQDTSYLFSRAHYLRKSEKAGEAAKLIAGMTRDPEILVDGDEWWVERRLIARKLLDDGDAKTAYEVVRDHGARAPDKRIEAEFHAGWIALRFLKDAALASGHFAEAGRFAETPISIARVAYWQGRAAEARGAAEDARGFFARAAALPITYYGQLARAKLGERSLTLRVADAPEEERVAFDKRPAAQAVRLLSAAGLKDLTIALYAGLATNLKKGSDLDALGQLALEQNDARAALLVGKAAVQRGYPLDLHAYPTNGIPSFEAVAAATPVEKAMVYAIARQESAFDPRAQSGVGARGLMQMMPATAQRTAKRYGLEFDQTRLLDDPAYNATLGSAHLGELMQDWKGSYILAFASYNAGGGNVKKWIDAYGDPRAPGVDPVDWVERIPFSETRNYVQRVMENLQVYRRRLDEKSALVIESDLRRGGVVQ
jgi:soluble lytic murein transglycosylase